MSDAQLTPADLRQRHADDIAKARTFQAFGISEQAAKDYLDTREGRTFRESLIRADPAASITDIDRRAIGQLRSGRELPRMVTIDEPLVKVVPAGTPMSEVTPFFARQSAFEDAVARGYNLSQYFGLPIRSEATVYDIYRIVPNGPTEVFVNTIAPTSELGGRVASRGGAKLVSNRRM